VSIGLAFYPANGENADRLMHNADRALYSVKHSGKGAVHVFNAADDDGAHVHGAQVHAKMR